MERTLGLLSESFRDLRFAVLVGEWGNIGHGSWTFLWFPPSLLPQRGLFLFGSGGGCPGHEIRERQIEYVTQGHHFLDSQAAA